MLLFICQQLPNCFADDVVDGCQNLVGEHFTGSLNGGPV
jgi:hypothetical protein